MYNFSILKVMTVCINAYIYLLLAEFSVRNLEYGPKKRGY